MPCFRDCLFGGGGEKYQHKANSMSNNFPDAAQHSRRCRHHTGRATFCSLKANSCDIWSAVRLYLLPSGTAHIPELTRGEPWRRNQGRLRLLFVISAYLSKAACASPSRPSSDLHPSPALLSLLRLRKEKRPSLSLNASLTSLPVHEVTAFLYCRTIYCPPYRWGTSTRQ